MTKSLEQMRSDWDRRAVDDTLYWAYMVHGRQFADLDFYFSDGARHARRMVEPRLAEWGEDPSGKTVLEIGCGIGRLFPGFAQLGFSRIVGVDVSPEMVSRGRKLCPIGSAEFLVGEGDRLAGIESGSVDYCFSYNVLGHLPSRKVFWHNLDEISRVLRPGGFIQAHFRGRHSLKRRIARRIPDSCMPAARFMYRKARMKPARAANRPGPGDPGHMHTWEFGVAIAPSQVSKKLRKMGFWRVRVQTDTDYADGTRSWATGRKRHERRPMTRRWPGLVKLQR